MNVRFSVILASVLVSMSAFAQQPDAAADTVAASSGGLPSPYFVDDVHCEGVNVREIKDGWLIEKDEVAAAQKVENEDMCERVLRSFGVVKFMWLTPDDLERTATVIRQSEAFKESDLSIQKSELKNHVHVFLKVKPIDRFSPKVAEDFRYYAPNGQPSSRMVNHLSGELEDRRYGPVATQTWGVSLWNTTAGGAMNIDPGNLTTDDSQKLGKKNAYLAEISWNDHSVATKHLSYDVGIKVTNDNTYSDDQSRFNVITTGDLLLTQRIQMFKGATYIGPAYILSTYTPYQVSQSNQNNQGSSVFFPGLRAGFDYGHEFANHFDLGVEYYHASGDQSIFQTDFVVQRNVGHLNGGSGNFLVAGFHDRNVQDTVLPQDRFPLSSPDYEDGYVGLAHVWRGVDSAQQMDLRFGGETINYMQDQPNFSGSANYVGLAYKTLMGDWNVAIAARYDFQRLY